MISVIQKIQGVQNTRKVRNRRSPIKNISAEGYSLMI